MQLSKQVQYALLFVFYLQEKQRASIQEAATELKISKSFLAQIAGKLRKAGVVVSERGAAGGYSLAIQDPHFGLIWSVFSEKISEAEALTNQEADEWISGSLPKRYLLVVEAELRRSWNAVMAQPVSSFDRIKSIDLKSNNGNTVSEAGHAG